MIQIHINPARVEKVLFVAKSDIEEDFDFAAWQAIRALVDQIDKRLGRIVSELRRKRQGDGDLSHGPLGAMSDGRDIPRASSIGSAARRF